MCTFRMIRGSSAVATILLGLFVLLSASGCKTPADGVLSPYLVGTFDITRDSLSTVLQIINPTADSLKVVAYFFDDNEHFLKCVTADLTPNDMVELGVALLGIKAEVGVVKIVSFEPGTEKPKEGIVGYKRTYVLRTFTAETVLFSVPSPVLAKDLPVLLKACR